MNTPPDTVVVGRIGRPHGVRGEATVEVRTDDPDDRFVPGAVLLTDPAARGPLTVAGARWHREVLLLAFEGYSSREDVETLRDTLLEVPVADLPELEDPESFYDHQLVGLAVRLADGSPLGTVTAVRHEGADLLVVARDGGRELLVPFVTAIVPTVDLAAGVVVVDPPEGLLDL
ncbi:16S rRNA processing protein RimM [Geodermatophilus tzadiensis]|uniref:Ribosome maturation factor RimM n=1 Tax=Geodermatophilus tzadiensis TaxID=1137988 RepID=A0A2T0TIX2_9ACTN|nr:ribosome maturation factor RimM [Geodermatophilus tzadiensis]PRY45664.1 16S rRNA processing protein RimM [Geodermatophilus tzadiensis]